MLSNFVFSVIVNTTALLGILLCGCGGPKRGDAAATGTATAQLTTAQGPAAPTTGATASPALSNGTRAPRLSFELSEMKERTGAELGLAVPMLLVTLRNSGRDPIDVPQPGVDLILSLRVSIKPAGGKPQQRYATLLRPWTVQLAPLSPAEPIRQGLSPLSVKRDDVALAPGRYRVAVCVPPSSEAPYPSRFTDLYGGQCSNEIEIESQRRH